MVLSEISRSQDFGVEISRIFKFQVKFQISLVKFHSENFATLAQPPSLRAALRPDEFGAVSLTEPNPGCVALYEYSEARAGRRCGQRGQASPEGETEAIFWAFNVKRIPILH